MSHVRFVASPLAGALSFALALPVAAVSTTSATSASTSAETTSDITTATTGAAAAKELDTVEVHGTRGPELNSPKFTRPLLDTPQTVTIVPAKLMKEQGVTTLRDALRNVPGISMQAGEGGVPAGDNLSLRGFSARTDLFVDGVRDFGGYSRDPFNLEQIEVVKGPASAQTGRGSTGGSINLASKTASRESLNRVGLSVGDNALIRGTADFNHAIGESSAFRVNLMGHHNEVSGRDVVESERWGLAPTLALGLGTDTTLNLSLFHLEHDNVPDYGQPWLTETHNLLPRSQRAPVDRSNFYGLTGFDYEKTETDMATLELRHAFSETLSLRNLTRWGQSTRDSIVTAPRFAGDNSTLVNRTLKTRDSQDRILSNLTDINARFTTGSVEHDLVAGLELSHERSRNRARTAPNGPQADLLNPDVNQVYNGTISVGAYSRTLADSTAVYVFDTAVLSPMWELSGGLRYDRFRADAGDRNIASDVPPRTDEELSARAALVFKPQENGSIHLGYGTSFNPSAEGMSLNTALAAVEPEKSRTLELGTKWTLFGDKLLLSSALFRTDKTNMRVDIDGSSSGVLYALVGEQRVDGFEISVAGKLTDAWTLNVGYALLDSELVNDPANPTLVGNALPNTPKQSASLWTTYQLSDALDVGFGVQHVGARYTAVNNFRKAKSYTLYDAMIGYRISDALALRLNATNLSDKDYVDTVGGGHYIPGAGRTLMLSADFSF